MKKIIVTLMISVFLISVSGLAFAEEFKGKVTNVDGKLVTIKITKGKAEDIAVDSKVTIETKDGAPKKKGGGMLQGC